MPEDTTYDVLPIRTGAAPTLSIEGARLQVNPQYTPVSIRMTGAIVNWLRWHFGAASRIEFPVLVDRVWTANDETSRITIASLAEWKPVVSDHRPALLVDRLDQNKDMNLRGIGDQLQGIKPGTYCHYLQGSHVVHAIGGREGEAEFLAHEVWRELVRFGPVARRALCLERFLAFNMGKRVQLSDDHKETYTVPVVSTYGYQEAWKVRPLDEEEINQVTTIFDV